MASSFRIANQPSNAATTTTSANPVTILRRIVQSLTICKPHLAMVHLVAVRPVPG